MTLLNDADAIYIGSAAADRVYLGSELVWEAGEPAEGSISVAALAPKPIAAAGTLVGVSAAVAASAPKPVAAASAFVGVSAAVAALSPKPTAAVGPLVGVSAAVAATAAPASAAASVDVTTSAGTGPTDTLLATFVPGAARNDFTGQVGVRYGIGAADVTVKWLGVFCLTGSGTRTVHVSEYFADANLRTVTVDMAGKTPGEWVWVPITPLTLLANGYYSIMQETTASDGLTWSNADVNAIAIGSDEVSNVYSSYRSPGGGTNPTTPNAMYVGLDLGWGDAGGGSSVSVAVAATAAPATASGSAIVPVKWNPSDKSAQVTLSDSDRTVANTAQNTFGRGVRATRHVSAGKWCVEYLLGGTAHNATFVGIRPIGDGVDDINTTAGSGAHYVRTGLIHSNGVRVDAVAASFTSGDVITVAVDHDNDKVYFAKNGVWRDSHNPATGTGGYVLTDATFAASSNVSVAMTSTIRSTAAEIAYLPSGFTPYAEM